MFQNAQNTPLSGMSKAAVLSSLQQAGKKKESSAAEGVFWGNGHAHALLTWNNHIHFDPSYTPWKHLGYKIAVAANTKLIAAGCKPATMQLSITCSSLYSLEALEELSLGFYAFAEKYKIAATIIEVSTTKEGIYLALAASSEKIGIKEFSKAKKNSIGDLVCVSGDLGGAYLGLLLLEREKKIFKDVPDFQPDLENKDYIVGRQLVPELRQDVIDLLRQSKVEVLSMTPVIEGLAVSLQKLSTDQLGIVIYEDKLPIDSQTQSQCIDFTIDPTVAALNGGEDYELCFTVAQSSYEAIKQLMDVSVIGYMTDQVSGAEIILRSGNTQKIEALRFN